MRKTAIDIAKRMPYPMLLRAFLAWHGLVDTRKINRVRAATGVRSLSELDLSAHKKSDTVFVLGGGKSINRISDARWQSICKHDTWGLNFWMCHRIIPDLYFAEAIKSYTPHILAAYTSMAADNATRYAHVPKILSELYIDSAQNYLQALPLEWQGSLYTAIPVTPPARTPAEFRYALQYLRGLGLFQSRTEIGRVFKYAISLSMLIALAVNMGYKRIVLCGADLTSAEYFYQDPELYPRYCNFQPEAPNQSHRIVRDFPWYIGAHDVLKEMRAQVLTPAGIELCVEHTGSALYPDIPLAPAIVYGEPCPIQS
jgi:hypothetical protein